MERIETLIPFKESNWKPEAKLGKLNLKDSPHAISAKLGRFLTKNIDEETRERLAQTLAETLTGQHVEPYTPEPGSLAASLTKDTENLYTYIADDGTIVYAADKMPARLKGGITKWHWTRRRSNETVRTLGFRIATAVGALEIVGEEHVPEARQVIFENHRYFSLHSAIVFFKNVVARWDAEIGREANRRFADAHNAGVFTDKKQCDDAHRKAASESEFAMFRHVEIDDDIDLKLFAGINSEFKSRWTSGELPQISMDNAFRFRKTGRHKAIGVYSAGLRAIAVDPRAPRSLLHEFAHAYDYEHGQLSCSAEFAPILDKYRKDIDLKGMTETETRYALTPTEIFARCWEMHALLNGKGGSFVGTEKDYEDDPLYKPLDGMRDDIETYFSTIE